MTGFDSLHRLFLLHMLCGPSLVGIPASIQRMLGTLCSSTTIRREATTYFYLRLRRNMHGALHLIPIRKVVVGFLLAVFNSETSEEDEF